MASLDGGSVTIDRAHFETLVNRGNFHTGSSSRLGFSAQVPSTTVFVSKVEYKNLQHIAQQYENLKQNLLRGGVDQETITLLSKDDKTIQTETQQATSTNGIDLACRRSSDRESRPGAFSPRFATQLNDITERRPSHSDSHSSSGHGRGYGGRHYTTQDRFQGVADWNDGGVPEEDEAASSSDDTQGWGKRRPNQRQRQNQSSQPAHPKLVHSCMRTIHIRGVPEVATHADVVAAVRGGQLLDIYLRAHDRTALVSFLHAGDAQAFFEHTKRYDLYIRNKRVDIRWGDRQFTLPGHVACKIGLGATRNLVIRKCSGRFTEERIREDLEHIHNLVVLKVAFVGANCYINTNSVHNALFARTCMMSRATYKGVRIQWCPDECAQPLVDPPAKKTAKKPAPAPVPALANRFQVLDTNDDETDGTEADDNEGYGGVAFATSFRESGGAADVAT